MYPSVRGPLAIVSLMVLGTAISLASGCGAPTHGSVRGQVTWNGQPIESGIVLFVVKVAGGNGDEIAVPLPIEQGRYQSTGELKPGIGLNRVSITAHRKTGKKRKAQAVGPDGRTTNERIDVDVTEQYIPAGYNQQSRLEREVKPGDNQFDFALDDQ